MTMSQRLRAALATVLMMMVGVPPALGLPVAGPPAAQKVTFDVPSQSVADGVIAFGRQSGLTIMLAVAALNKDVASPALNGNYTPAEALEGILAPTGPKEKYVDLKTVAVTAEGSDSEDPDSIQPAGAGARKDASQASLPPLQANETRVLIDGRGAVEVSTRGTANQPGIAATPLPAKESMDVLPSSSRAICGAMGGAAHIALKKNLPGGEFGYVFENPDSHADRHSVGGGDVVCRQTGNGFDFGDLWVLLLIVLGLNPRSCARRHPLNRRYRNRCSCRGRHRA